MEDIFALLAVILVGLGAAGFLIRGIAELWKASLVERWIRVKSKEIKRRQSE